MKTTLRRRLTRRLSSLVVRVSDAISKDPDRFLRDALGVVHVGANTGQERELYDGLALRVLWIEPLPDVFATLEANLQGISRQRAICALLTDRVGATYKFNVAGNGGASSSILEFKEHKKIWPDVGYVGVIEMQSTTLDSLFVDEGIDANGYDALVLDVQGAELLVLRGALESLLRFKYVKVEVADFEAYAGCCRTEDIAAFMAENGFVEHHRNRFASGAGVGSYFDIVYRRGDA